MNAHKDNPPRRCCWCSQPLPATVTGHWCSDACNMMAALCAEALAQEWPETNRLDLPPRLGVT